MATLSVAIITLNEERTLARTLASVAFADEVVLVDSGSTDGTLAIAGGFPNVRIFERPWPGFAPQKNFALDQCTGDWLLSLDADEELPADMQLEIQSLLRDGAPADAFLLRRKNFFLGRWIRHGRFYPDPKLRLFRRTLALRFEERAVHETIPLRSLAGAKVHMLRSALLHDAYPTLSAYIEHMDRYSTLGAGLLVTKGRTSRNPIAFFWNVFYAPQLQFVWNYIFALGFLDGREGLLLHWYHASYTSWKYAKAWEQSRR